MDSNNLRPFVMGLGSVSLQAAIMVVAIYLTQLLFRKQLSPRWRCALWMLVLIRLVLPISPTSALSIFNLVPRWSRQPEPRSLDASPFPVATKENLYKDTEYAPKVSAVPSDVLTIRQQPVLVQTPVKGGRLTSDNALTSERAAETSVAVTGMRSSTVKFPSWSAMIFAAWLTGFLLLASYVVLSAFRIIYRFGTLAPITDSKANRVLEECRRQMGFGGQLTLVECPEVSSPALYGLLRPHLLMPKGFTFQFNDQELRFIFLHELAHLRRWDLPLNWLVVLVQLTHWFNPLVWFGFGRWRADREMACDALVLETVGEDQNHKYGQTILRLLETFTHRSAAPGLVGILEDRRQMHRRLKMIAGFRTSPRWGILSAILMGVLGLVLLTDAQAPKNSSPTTPSTQTGLKRPKETPEIRVGKDPVSGDLGDAEAQTMTITVLDAATGKPLPDAIIGAPPDDWQKPQPRRLTDEQGHFVLRLPVPSKEQRKAQSNFNLQAYLKGYAGRGVAWSSGTGDVFATLPTEVTIKLERGETLGGIVQDEQGSPLAGIRVLLYGSGYQGFTIGTTEQKNHDYPEVNERDNDAPAAVTDSSGRWSYRDFPAGLERVEITLKREDGSGESFSTFSFPGLDQGPTISLLDLRAGKAVMELKEGLTVKGIVVDENGHALRGVTVQEGFGSVNITRLSEFTTDADGKFVRLHRVPREWIYTASAPGRATTSVIARVNQELQEVRIIMPLAKPLRFRVQDESGQPLPGVTLTIDPYKTEAQLLDWSSETDIQGSAIWTNAPLQWVTFYARQKSGNARKFKAKAGEAEKVIVLNQTPARNVKVQVLATDLASHQPVKIQAVNLRISGNVASFRKISEPQAAEFSVEIPRNEFRVGMYPSYELQLEAAGYETLTTEPLDLEEGEQSLNLGLVAAAEPAGVLLTPAGEPAGDARIWISAGDMGESLFCNGPGRYYGDRLVKGKVEPDGKFRIAAGPRERKVIFTHPAGTLRLTAGEISSAASLQLEPWGGVEGTLLVAGQPKKGMSVNISSLFGYSTGFYLIYNATTDAEGKFNFTNVPPGEYRIYRQVQTRIGRPITESHPLVISVQAGTTTEIQYGGAGGRTVVGQAQPAPVDLEVDWQNDDHVLALKRPALHQPKMMDFATTKSFQAAYKEFYNSGARQEQEKMARAYVLSFEKDGSFRVDDVPPGRYELSIHVNKPSENQGFNRFNAAQTELGSLVREVVIPEGNGVMDLGVLPVKMKEGIAAPKTPSFEVKGQTLDGEPFVLSQYRGRYVLLTFWAAWSERSREQMDKLGDLSGRFESSKVAFVGLNLDEEPAAAKEVLKAKDWKGPQAWLGPEARVKTTAAFDVNTLPAMFLLDPQGRVVGRDLENERLEVALNRALSKR